MIDVFEEAARPRVSSNPAALATVIRTVGSVPRRAGAKMIVHPDGAIVGTIGGGRVENEIVNVGRAVARGQSGPTRWRKHLVHDLAMCCGGEMELWVEPLDDRRIETLAEVVRRRRARAAVAVRTSLVPPGGKSVAEDDPCVRTRRTRLEDDAFFEPAHPRERMILFGAGHIAHALAPAAASVDFDVVVCDEDENFCTAERFPDATRHESFEVDEIERAIGLLGAGDYVVLATRDHAVDQALLERLIGRRELAFLGMVGSRGKLGRFRRRLEAKGLDDQTAWARLRSPVGLAIGAETPEEIALAIVAELVQTRARERVPKSVSECTQDRPRENSERRASTCDPPR